MVYALTRVWFLISFVLVGVFAYQNDVSRRLQQGTTVAPLRLWPTPSSVEVKGSNGTGLYTGTLPISPCNFTFVTSAELAREKSINVDRAVRMYSSLIFRKDCTNVIDRVSPGTAMLTHLIVDLHSEGHSEGYTLSVGTADEPTARMTVKSYEGLLRGLETFSQLVREHSETEMLIHSGLLIKDSPSFNHRGILVDTARNFIPVKELMRVIDALMYSKMNILHLHISDSQSFPLQLTTGHGPDVTASGAYSKDEVYTVKDISMLVAYASTHGVTLIPEIDTPGHARAFGLAKGLEGIVSCANVSGSEYTSCCSEPPCGQLNPSSDLMYTVLGDALADVSSLFSDSAFIHLGFDEVNDNCWNSDPTIQEYMKLHDLNTSSLLREFFLRERKLVPSKHNTVYWDEVVTAGLHTQLHPEDVVQFWHKGNSGLLQEYLKSTPVSNRAILSAYTSYYLDCGAGNEFGQESWCDPYKTWRDMYFNDMLAGINQTAIDLGRVLGGESAIWTEVACAGNLDAALWPRAAAFGSRLWNYEAGTKAASQNNGWVDVELNIAAHASSLVSRGIGAGQVMPEFCQHQPSLCFPTIS